MPPLPPGPRGFFHRMKELGEQFRASGKVSAFGVDGALLTEVLKYQAATGTWWSVETSQENLARNRDVVLPLIDAAFSGDRAARALYEQERLFHLRHLPEWGQELVEDFIKARVASFRYGQKIPEYLGAFRKEIPSLRLSYDPQGVPAALGLTFVSSYATVDSFLNQSSAAAYDGPIGLTVGISGGRRTLIPVELYSPISPSGIGKHARQTMSEAAALMLKVLVLEDYLASIRVELPDSAKFRLFRSTQRAWELGDKPAIRVLPELKAELDAREPSIPAAQKEALLERFMFTPQALQDLRRFLDGPKPAAAAGESSILSERAPVVDIYRLNFINGVMAALLREHPTLEEPREVARRFFSLHRRGASSYMQIVHEIGKGGDPFELLGTIYTRELKRERGEAPKPRQRILESVESKEELLRRLVVVQRARIFEKWLNSLSDEFQAKVRGRLVRMELNNFGDWGPIGTNLRELRIDAGPGLRIYFARLSDCEVLLLCGGTKDSQSKDILRAHRLAHAIGLE